MHYLLRGDKLKAFHVQKRGTRVWQTYANSAIEMQDIAEHWTCTGREIFWAWHPSLGEAHLHRQYLAFRLLVGHLASQITAIQITCLGLIFCLDRLLGRVLREICDVDPMEKFKRISHQNKRVTCRRPMRVQLLFKTRPSDSESLSRQIAQKS